jgi:hypothetical protein
MIAEDSPSIDPLLYITELQGYSDVAVSLNALGIILKGS